MSLQQPVQRVIFWVIWFALLSGVAMMALLIPAPDNAPIPATAGTPLWLVAVAPLAISALVRWFVLPRATTAQAALPVFIIGMALAESAAIMGLFVFPDHRSELLVLGVLGILQFAPVFAGRFNDTKNR